MKGKLLIASLVILGISGGWVWWWMQGEATGTVHTGKVEEGRRESKKEDVSYQGKYVTMSIPGDFHEVSHNLPESGPLVESVYLAGGSEVFTEKIAVNLEKREEMSFEASPSYQMRTQDATYQLTKAGEGEFLEKHVTPYETSYFFWWEGYLVNLTYTSTQENKSAKTILESIAKSLQKPKEINEK